MPRGVYPRPHAPGRQALYLRARVQAGRCESCNQPRGESPSAKFCVRCDARRILRVTLRRVPEAESPTLDQRRAAVGGFVRAARRKASVRLSRDEGAK